MKNRLSTPTAKTMATVEMSHIGCDGSHMTTRKAMADSAISTQLATRNHWRTEWVP